MKFHEIPIKTQISLHSNVYFNGKLSKMSPWVSASFYREISDREAGVSGNQENPLTQEIIKVALDQTTNIGKYTKTKEKTSNQQPKHNKNVVTGKAETKNKGICYINSNSMTKA